MPYLNQRTHDRPFTVLVCQATACEAGGDLGLLDALRDTIRRCTHGVLVRTGCLLGLQRADRDGCGHRPTPRER